MLPILQHAIAEIGYTESPPGSNRTKFAAMANHVNGRAWCATFAVAMARSVGMHLPSESASTIQMAAGFKAARRWHTSPMIGDLAFFHFPGESAPINHVGIVEKISTGFVTCIEGNTSPGWGGSQSNGGGVYRRTRPYSLVVGFGWPEYKEAPMPDPGPPDYEVNDAPVSISITPTGKGYLIMCADGGVFAFGDAVYLGRVHKRP